MFTNPIGKQNETRKVMDINIDVCKFFKKRNRANPFTIYLTGLTEKYGKEPHCPMKLVRLFNILIYICKKSMKLILGEILRLQFDN